MSLYEAYEFVNTKLAEISNVVVNPEVSNLTNPVSKRFIFTSLQGTIKSQVHANAYYDNDYPFVIDVYTKDDDSDSKEKVLSELMESINKVLITIKKEVTVPGLISVKQNVENTGMISFETNQKAVSMAELNYILKYRASYK